MDDKFFVDVLVVNVPSLVSDGVKEFYDADSLWSFVTKQLPGTVFSLTHNYLVNGSKDL